MTHSGGPLALDLEEPKMGEMAQGVSEVGATAITNLALLVKNILDEVVDLASNGVGIAIARAFAGGRAVKVVGGGSAQRHTWSWRGSRCGRGSCCRSGSGHARIEPGHVGSAREETMCPREWARTRMQLKVGGEGEGGLFGVGVFCRGVTEVTVAGVLALPATHSRQAPQRLT